jgi:hypothetical protein
VRRSSDRSASGLLYGRPGSGYTCELYLYCMSQLKIINEFYRVACGNQTFTKNQYAENIAKKKRVNYMYQASPEACTIGLRKNIWNIYHIFTGI